MPNYIVNHNKVQANVVLLDQVTGAQEHVIIQPRGRMRLKASHVIGSAPKNVGILSETITMNSTTTSAAAQQPKITSKDTAK